MMPSEFTPPIETESLNFGFGVKELKGLTENQEFKKKNNEKCGDEKLVRDYPERFGAKFGQLKLDVQMAGEGSQDTIPITEGENIDVAARIWIHGKDEESSKCYLLGKNGKWYTRSSENPPKKENHVNYWKLGEPKTAEKSDIDLMKILISLPQTKN